MSAFRIIEVFGGLAISHEKADVLVPPQDVLVPVLR